jgi:transposase
LIEPKAEGIVDATGFESHYVSRYYRWKKAIRRKALCKRWPKLSVLCHRRSHLWAAARVGIGPSNDSPEFAPLVREADALADWGCVMADAAYDSEAHHLLCRETLGIERTIIPVQTRGFRKWPRSRYRREMRAHFARGAFGQRWQVESAFSQHKRRLGSFLRARSEDARERECYLRVLTHNLMILAEVA